jgi:hypothetical protein
MAEPRAVVRNAADPQQVRRGGKHERDVREEQLHAWRTVLALPEGRFLLWTILEQCQVAGSVYAPDVRIYYNAGRQDLGHYVIAEISEAQPNAWLTMQSEHQVRVKMLAPPPGSTADELEDET